MEKFSGTIKKNHPAGTRQRGADNMEKLQNVMQNLRIAAERFMLGRNGMDQLNYALLWGYALLYVLRAIIVIVTRSRLLGGLFDVLAWVILCALVFRGLSRNVARRQAENLRFLNVWRRVERNINGARKRHADHAHKYYTCRQCGTICRVPTGKGKIVITCPKCGAKINAKT